jgi:hypothetical protein|tara:strand:+ start:97 stop:426 length:330 start_codon:yes stop_codon:yes gene_type:complete
LDAVVVFATETFAPTNVDEVKAADMFVIIKLFLYGVFMGDSSKLKKAGSTELSTTEERFSSKRRSIDRKNCKKTRKKNKRFSFAEIDALLTEKKKQLFALNLIVLIFIN